MILIHGTTEKGLKAILARAGKEGLAAPWTVSDSDGLSYFFDLDKWADVNGFDMDDEDATECTLNAAIRQAMEQAVIQKVKEAEGGKVFALVVEVPEEFQRVVEEDTSCPGMDSAVCMPEENFDPAWIKRVFADEVNTWTLPAHLAVLLHNDYFDYSDLPEGMVAMAEALAGSDVVSDILDRVADYAEEVSLSSVGL